MAINVTIIIIQDLVFHLNYVRIWSIFGLFRSKQCRAIINLKKAKGQNLKSSRSKGVDITMDRFNKILKYL